MPQLNWNPVDLLEFFAVEPAVGDYEPSHTYEVHRGGLILKLIVKQLDASIELELFREGGQFALISFMAYVRGEVRYIDDKRGAYLEIEDSIIAPDYLWHIDARDLWKRDIWSPENLRMFSTTIRISIEPDIRVEFASHRSRT